MGSLTLDLEIGRLDPPVGVAKLAYLSPPRVGANLPQILRPLWGVRSLRTRYAFLEQELPIEKLSHHPPANQHTALPHNA